MKVLVISGEVWKDNTNGGNVLTNMFKDFDWEFAQIYCNPGKPQNTTCNHYYQMTDSMVIKNFFTRKPIGNEFVLNNGSYIDKKTDDTIVNPNQRFYSFFHRYNFEIFRLCKSILWNLSNWQNEKLNKFVLDFDPDIIFAPCYGNTFMLRLTRYVSKLTNKIIISYISDDSYTLKQFNLSPIYWLQRFSVRSQLRKTFPLYSLVYTMTKEQKEQCERDFKTNMKILLKSSLLYEKPINKNVNTPIKIVYAGGIYLNRWKTIKQLVNCIKEINEKEKKIQLDIYTNNEITSAIDKELNDKINSFIHRSVSQEELFDIYRNSDIALHVESFDLKNRLAVRMSFSTKIVDCLSSGCAVMAICDEKQGGFRYLKEEDAAICISNPKDIKNELQKLVDDTNLIKIYANKAKQCCIRNHGKEKISKMIKDDFEYYANLKSV